MRIDLENPPRLEPTRRSASAPWQRLLKALMDLCEGQAQLLSHAERPWASVTFAGTRHTVTLRFDGAEAVGEAEQFITNLPEHEFTLPGQLVADAAIVAVDQQCLPQPQITVQAELLLLDEG